MNLKYSLLFLGLAFFSFLIFWGCNSTDDPVAIVDECGITLSSPVSIMGPWNNGDELIIRWEKSGPAEFVKIELKKDGLVVGTIRENTANDGYFNWAAHLFEESNGNDFSISVTTLGDDSCSDSSQLLELVNTDGCNFTFSDPVADFADSLYVFDANNTLAIAWDSFNSSGNVKIELLERFGDVAGIIAFDIPDEGHFDWPVTSYHVGDHLFYKIRISDMVVDECSAESSEFGIDDYPSCTYHFSSPVYGAVLTEGTEHEIRLKMTNMTGDVDLWLFAGLEPVGRITTHVDGVEGQYTWLVDDFDYSGSPNMYRIRAIANDDNYCWGHSETFSIAQP